MIYRIFESDFEAHLGPLESWHHQCHAASIALVKCDALWPTGAKRRVARGSCPGVFGQHSWVVVSHDAYEDDAWIIDPTLWSYDSSVQGIWHGYAGDRPHTPHGYGSIFEAGKPSSHGGPPVEIVKTSLGAVAMAFLDMVEPLDLRGWMELANSPVLGWPAGEIITAMHETPELAALIPIDRLGMLTDLNPQGLYLPE